MSEAVKQFAEKQYDKGIVDSIKNIMKNMKLSAEQAMDALGIPKSEHKKYMTML